MVAWISFGKVGSSTMRVVFKRRAVEKGWQKWVPGRGWVGRDFYISPDDLLICHAKMRTGFAFNSIGQACHDATLCPNISMAPLCADAPDGYVVQTDFGYCDAIGSTVGRPCRYFTILREPIARAISAYNYFCLACAEDGRQCVENEATRARLVEENKHVVRDAMGLPLTRPQRSCPDMSVVDYVSLEGGNYYVRRLSATQEAGFVPNGYGRMGEEQLAAALERLRRPDMLVVFTEELSTIALGALSRYLDDELELVQRKNVHTHRMAPNATELMKLQRMLSRDIELYNTLWAEHTARRISTANRTRAGQRKMTLEPHDTDLKLAWQDGYVMWLPLD